MCVFQGEGLARHLVGPGGLCVAAALCVSWCVCFHVSLCQVMCLYGMCLNVSVDLLQCTGVAGCVCVTEFLFVW